MLTNYNTSLVYIYGYRHEVDSRINNSIISLSLNPTFLSHPPRQNSTNPFQEISVCLSFLVTPILDKYYSSLSKNTFDINYQGGGGERDLVLRNNTSFWFQENCSLLDVFSFFLIMQIVWKWKYEEVCAFAQYDVIALSTIFTAPANIYKHSLLVCKHFQIGKLL